MNLGQTDICLIVEGSYPYVPGGVSSWTHDLINKHDHLSFHILAILPPGEKPEMKYDLPKNVNGVTNIYLQKMPEGTTFPGLDDMLNDLKAPLGTITAKDASLEDYKRILAILNRFAGRLGKKPLLDSEESWQLVQAMYEEFFEESSYLDYFWSWRALMGGIFSISTVDLPKAKTYHALSTGYAGLLAARAKIETNSPVMLTEHGIYTNERRIEVASADWLQETASKSFTVDKVRYNLRDFWAQSFTNFSRICYDACDEIITLYQGNQRMQLEDGADEKKMQIIPNGVHIERFREIKPVPHDRPTIALIGRVVPIKDIKSFIRAVSSIKEIIPDIEVLVIGPTDEDIEYYQECRQMIEYMGLSEAVTFTGRVHVDNYLSRIDVTVLSSISEAMPLTVLEAGACGIPSVTTDVGACREIIYGRDDEEPSIGAGGAVVAPSNPTALAKEIVKLLTDNEYYNKCSTAIRERVERYYDKKDQVEAYNTLYNRFTGQQAKRKAS